jgi:hypothetical protein
MAESLGLAMGKVSGVLGSIGDKIGGVMKDPKVGEFVGKATEKLEGLMNDPEQAAGMLKDFASNPGAMVQGLLSGGKVGQASPEGPPAKGQIGGAGWPAYKPTWLNQLYTWGIFGGALMLSWDSALTVAVSQLNSDSDEAYLAGSPRVLRRSYLLALVLYAIVVAWFTIVFMMLSGYCACALLVLTAPLCKDFWERYIVRKLFVPALVFNCMDLAHAPFHIVAAISTFFAAAVMIGFYVTDDDLLKQHHMHSKAVRALFIPPAAIGVVYALYALFCSFTAGATTPPPLKEPPPAS